MSKRLQDFTYYVPKWPSKIGGVVYINLEKRPDRRKHMETNVRNKLSLSPQTFVRQEAVDWSPGFTGCTRSHVLALKQAQFLWPNASHVVIMEDDFDLSETSQAFHRRLDQGWEKNPKFDVLFLAMNPIRLKKQDKDSGLCRVFQALCMSGYIIRKDYIPILLHDMFEESLKQKKPHDLLSQSLQPRDEWYGFWPPLGHQLTGYSDIENKDVDYRYLDIQGMQLGYVE